VVKINEKLQVDENIPMTNVTAGGKILSRKRYFVADSFHTKELL